MSADNVNGADMEELKRDLASLKDKVGSLELEVTRQYAALETDVRVTKHDVANLKDMFSGFGLRIDRMEGTFRSEIKSLEHALISKVETLAAAVAVVNVKHERSLGFFGGVIGSVTFAGALLMLLAKYLFPGA